MASRVRGFGMRPVVEENEEITPEVVAEVHKPVFVDKAILNEAVETTLEGADVRHADTMRRLWAMDQDSDAAHAYFADQVRKRVQSNYAAVSRREHVVNEVLNQHESAQISDYAREFNLVFRNVTGNEHGFFSARRGIDHQILQSKFPANMDFLDFGGSVQYHARMGHTNAITVSPFDMDKKDPTRAALTKLALRKLAANTNESNVTREIARSVLAGEGKYHRSESVQTTEARALFSLAIHVYDVPIQDWPYMMERCGVRVHEGCMHFANDFFESAEGEFAFSGARWEIDKSRDLFRMRVGVNSASWYEHKWTDYMRYGANQILSTDKGRYSYQIVERRQDTIFYRILRVDATATRNVDQYYALPSVPMVEVEGFKVMSAEKPHGRTRRALERHNYLFPAVLWQRMLDYASAELDRGGLSYGKLFNFYRTVVPRQSINSVLVSGGQSVPILDVPGLVVMAGTVAYGDALLLQRTIRARTDEIEHTRSLLNESTVYKGFRVFLDALVAVGSIPFSPFASLSSKMGKGYMALVKQKLVTWQPRVRHRAFNAALFVDHKMVDFSIRMPDQINYAAMVDDDVIGRMVDLSAADPNVARELLSSCGDGLSPKVRRKFEDSVGSETMVEDQSDAAEVQSVDKPGVMWTKRPDGVKLRRTVFPPRPDFNVVSERRLAVQEALEECTQEAHAMEYTCARVCRDVLVSGRPNEHVMRQRAEELYNPDLWKVSNGVLVESVLNPGSREFAYSGVYVPGMAGNALYPVHEVQYNGKATQTGQDVTRDHYVIPVEYTGYVLVLDGLKIFNGPAVSETLSRVLEMGDEHYLFHLTAHQGPPGCGKTTTVTRDGDPTMDVFLAPTRVAKQGLVKRLSKNHNMSERAVSVVCRTLDSLLVNYASLPAKAKQGFRKLCVDEYVLARSGKWYAAAILLGVGEVHMYGDNRQIKHVPRVDVPKFFLEIKPQILEEEFLGYRNAKRILAAYNFVYNNEVRTASQEEGTVMRVKTMKEVTWMKNARLLSMHQADKKYLNQIAHSVGKDAPVVNTTHEAQGSDCDQLVLFNAETRKRSSEDSFYLYGLLDYCLVAISRARLSFVYVKQSDEPDMITRMIEYSQDVRRVQAAGDVATQGVDNLTHFR